MFFPKWVKYKDIFCLVYRSDARQCQIQFILSGPVVSVAVYKTLYYYYYYKIFQSFSKNFKIFENFHIFLAHKKCVTPNFLVILVTHRDRLVKKVPCYKFCQSFGLLSTNIQRFSWFKGYPRGSMTVRIGSKSSYLGVGGYLADRWPVSKNFGIASNQLAYDPPVSYLV